MWRSTLTSRGRTNPPNSTIRGPNGATRALCGDSRALCGDSPALCGDSPAPRGTSRAERAVRVLKEHQEVPAGVENAMAQSSCQEPRFAGGIRSAHAGRRTEEPEGRAPGRPRRREPDQDRRSVASAGSAAAAPAAATAPTPAAGWTGHRAHGPTVLAGAFANQVDLGAARGAIRPKKAFLAVQVAPSSRDAAVFTKAYNAGVVLSTWKVVEFFAVGRYPGAACAASLRGRVFIARDEGKKE